MYRTYAKRSAGPEMRKGEAEEEKEELDMELWEGEWKEMEGSGGGGDPFMMGEEILPLQFNPVKKNIKVRNYPAFGLFLYGASKKI